MTRSRVPARAALLSAALVAAVVVAVGLAGVRSHGTSAPTPCHPPAGGRCAADSSITGPLTVGPGGRSLRLVVLCGGTLTARESSTRVVVRLRLASVGAGAMMCARPVETVTLHAPLAGRTVVDAVSGHPIRLVSPTRQPGRGTGGKTGGGPG